jgi:two-component system response regulator PilR (NtrC family)
MGARILVCDDEAGLREMLGVLLRRAGYEVELIDGARPAIARLAQEPALDLVVCDLAMPDGSGMEVLSAAKRRDDALQVIMVTAFATTEQAVEAMRLGAYDYIQKPFKNNELLAQVDKALEKSSIVLENRALRAQVTGTFRVGNLIGKSPRMRGVMDLVQRVASGRASVLITGESGTGKELAARRGRARGAALRQRELRGAAGGADGERAVRPRKGRVHGRERAQGGAVPGGAGRDAVPR